jgi:hypothetical protein
MMKVERFALSKKGGEKGKIGGNTCNNHIKEKR